MWIKLGVSAAWLIGAFMMMDDLNMAMYGVIVSQVWLVGALGR